MKKMIWLFLFVTFSQLNAAQVLVHEAFLTRYTEVSVPVAIPAAPPAPILENVPPRPSQDEIWIPGYWSWIDSDNKYEWVCGVWRRPPPNLFWIPGAWVLNTNGWVWARGFWNPAPIESLTYIAVAPPRGIDDLVPPSPGNNYFWVPGYWNYSLNNNNYGWLSGKWEVFNPSWILTPSSYYWRPQGYVFVPMFWDWPLEVRGHAFSCADGIALSPEIIVQNFFFFYPDYHLFYWHWWHFHPGWGWDGCGCLPPWWFWDDWWAFGWGDSWGLWWWWGHPGFFPPAWLSIVLSDEIAPPPLVIIDAFPLIKEPPITIKLGDKPLLPKGPEGSKTKPPKPRVPHDVTPIGPVKLPTVPGQQVVTPPPPPSNVTPPQSNTTPNYNPPQQPNYVPPQKQPPSTYYPPQGNQPNYPRTPPSQTQPLPPPKGTPPKTPPSTRNPVTPPSNKSPVTPPSNKSPVTPPRNQTPTKPTTNKNTVTPSFKGKE